MEQRPRYAVGIGGHEDAGTIDALRSAGFDTGNEGLERYRILSEFLVEQLAPELPGRQQRKHRQPQRQRKPAAIEDLDDVGREEGKVDDDEEDQKHGRTRPAPLPKRAYNDKSENRVDHHRQRHGDAVGRRQVRRRAKTEDDDDDRQQE
jgi:hypothetical protein